ncbi:MAG: DUF2256 domain-containing protein [Pseudomonadota bacterium]
MRSRQSSARSRRGRGKPQKVCPVCDRPFEWRARWKNNWDEIVYCSRRCASERRFKHS